MLFLIDARDEDAAEQALEISKFNLALLKRVSQTAASVGSSPEMARGAMATVAARRPRGITVRALCPTDGTFGHWVGYANFALTDAEANFLCRECDSRPAPELPTELAIIDFGGFGMTRTELRRAVRGAAH